MSCHKSRNTLENLQSMLRRNRADSSIAKYTSFIKKANKDAKRSVASLKQMENQMAGLAPVDVDHHVSVVIRVLREVSAASISIFQSLLLFLSMPVLKSRPSRWSLVSKLIQKGEVACKNQIENLEEFEGLEGSIEGIEKGLEGMFRRLVGTRASLLNIMSYL